MSREADDALRSLLLEEEDASSSDGLDDVTPLYSRAGGSGTAADSLFEAEDSGLPKKKATRHRLRGYFARRGSRIFYITYLMSLLTMVMIFVVVYTQVDIKDPYSSTVEKWCGPDRFSFAGNGTNFLGDCFLEIAFGLPISIAGLLTLGAWLLTVRPVRLPRRAAPFGTWPTATKVAAIARIVCAGCVSLVPDVRIITEIFDLENNENDLQNLNRIPLIVPVSEVLRTMCWLLVFVTLFFCMVRDIRIPSMVRHSCLLYAIYRVLFLVWVLLNPNKNDARLVLEIVSFVAAIVLGGLLTFGFAERFAWLEPQSGGVKRKDGDKKSKKAHVYWPTFTEIWQLMEKPTSKIVTVCALFFCIAEGIVRVYTFKFLEKEKNEHKKMAFYVMVFLVGILRALNRGFASYNMLRLTNDLKARLFGIALQSTRYFVTNSKGEINQTIHYYLDREFLATLFQSAVDALVPTVTVIYSTIYLFTVSWRLSILVGSILVFFSMFTLWRNYYTSLYQRDFLILRDEERYQTMDVFDGFEAVQLYAQEHHEEKRFRETLEKSWTSGAKLYTFDILGDFFESTILTSSVIVAVAYGTVLATKEVNGKLLLEPADLNTYGLVALNAMMSIKGVTGFITQISKTRLSGDKVMRLIWNPHPARLDELDWPSPEPDININLEKVWFAYTRPQDPQEDVDYKLKDVTTSFPRGKSVALVGHTGCGKSTMVKLILREYSVENGEGIVTLDGIDMRHVSPRWLYSRVAYVPQKPVIFDESIFYNLVYGWDAVDERGEISEEDRGRLVGLLKAVGLAEFLHPGTECRFVMDEKKAAETSGGQQQRIGIVRALLRRPKLMVLDEVTSALDGNTEAKVIQLIEELARAEGATVIMIAHRYATIRNCDEILVLRAGSIMERGTYAELEHKPGGEFQSLLQAQ